MDRFEEAMKGEKSKQCMKQTVSIFSFNTRQEIQNKIEILMENVKSLVWSLKMLPHLASLVLAKVQKVFFI